MDAAIRKEEILKLEYLYICPERNLFTVTI